MTNQPQPTPAPYDGHSQEWRSFAIWPDECCPAIGNRSDDRHATKEAAEAVCQLLHEHGFGGDGIFFPLKTWVEPIPWPQQPAPREPVAGTTCPICGVVIYCPEGVIPDHWPEKSHKTGAPKCQGSGQPVAGSDPQARQDRPGMNDSAFSNDPLHSMMQLGQAEALLWEAREMVSKAYKLANDEWQWHRADKGFKLPPQIEADAQAAMENIRLFCSSIHWTSNSLRKVKP